MSYDGDLEPNVALFSVEAEMSALGAMLLSETAVGEVVESLVAEDFTRPSHRLIFEAMLRLVGKAKAVDPVNLRDEIRDHGDLAAIGGQEYLNELDLYVPSASNVASYVATIKDKAMRRNGLAALKDLERQIRRGETADTLTEAFRALPAVIQTGGEQAAHVDLRRLLLDEESWTEAEVVSSGNPYLDHMTESGGLKCGSFSISSAPTGEGKTTWALAVLFEALDRGERCAYLSFTDLTQRDILIKAIRWLCGIAGTAACKSEDDRRRVMDAKDHIYRNWDWVVYDATTSPGAIYVETAIAWLRRMQAEGLARKESPRPVRVAVWDYYQMIRSNAAQFRTGKATAFQELTHVAREFRLFTAQMATAHAIMCAQLSDEKDKEWIRDCKEIEFGCEFWFRVKKEGLKIRKRRFGGKTDVEPPHHHHPRRHTFVPEGGNYNGRFED